MKRTISTIIMISMFAVAALADGPIVPPNPNCTQGHINTPASVCEPPVQSRNEDGETGHGNRTADNDSVISTVTDWIAEFNPFVYFVN